MADIKGLSGWGFKNLHEFNVNKHANLSMDIGIAPT